MIKRKDNKNIKVNKELTDRSWNSVKGKIPLKINLLDKIKKGTILGPKPKES